MHERRTIAAVVVGLVVLLCLAVVGLRALGIGRHRPAVALIGDSITANLENTADRRLGDDYALTVDGRPGFLADQQLGTVIAAGRLPFDQIVINLGTNDVMTSDHDLTETGAVLRQMADATAGIRCVHLVTVNEEMINDDGSADSRARQLNQEIRQIAATHPNVSVIDWATILASYQQQHHDVITVDTVHPDDVGNRVLADAYGDALDACGS